MTMKLPLQIGFTILITCLVLSTDLSAQINNGSFESGGCFGQFTTLGNGSTNITGWVVGGHSVDYICRYWQASDGARSIDLNGKRTGPGEPDDRDRCGLDISGNIRSVRQPGHPAFKTSISQPTLQDHDRRHKRLAIRNLSGPYKRSGKQHRRYELAAADL